MVLKKSDKDLTDIKSNEEYQAIIKNILDLIIEIDFNGNFTYISPQCKEIFGYDPSEVMGRKALRYVHPEDLNIVMESMREAIENQKQMAFEYRAKHKDGSYIHVSAKGGAVKEEKKLLVVVRNISEKIEADLRLKESEEKYRNLFDESPYLILLCDISGKILEVNKTTMEKIALIKKQDLVGKSFLSLGIFPPDNLMFFKKTFDKLLITGKIEPVEVKIENPDVKLKWVRIQANIIQIGQKRLIQAIIEDISEKKKTELKAKESEKNYRNIVENTMEAVVIIDLKGRLQYVSPQLSKILKGREIKETSRFFHYIHKDDKSRIIDFYRETVKNKFFPDIDLEFRILTNEKKYIWLSSSSKNYFDDNGNINGFITTLKDVTDKKIAEEKLRDSEVRYRLIFENSNDLIRVLNDKFEIEYLNERIHREILGYSKDELLGQVDIMLNDVDDYKEIRRNMLNLFKVGEGVYESRMRHKEGHYLWFEEKIKMFRDDKSRQKYLFISRDITEKKLTELRLKESEEKYRDLFENSPSAIIVTDINGKVLDQNVAVEKIFGINRKDSIGQNFGAFNVFDKEQISLLANRARRLLKGEKLKPISLKVRNISGNELWILHHMSIVSVGEYKLIESIVQDITERKKAEEIIKTENKRLLELNNMKNELVSRVSHELKTPLNSIYGGAQILLNLYKESTCEQALEFIEMIHKGGQRLKSLVENLLDISRVESGKLRLKLENVDLVKIIKERTDEIKYFVAQRDLTMQSDLPNEAYCDVDKIRIGQVITNLLSNAIKNTPANGIIKVSLRKVEDALYISVEDSGVGLSEEDMDKLFKKFGKIERYGHQMDVDIEGSGLGLYISKEIIDLHGGSIWVESEGKNRGSNFIIKLHKAQV